MIIIKVKEEMDIEVLPNDIDRSHCVGNSKTKKKELPISLYSTIKKFIFKNKNLLEGKNDSITGGFTKSQMEKVKKKLEKLMVLGMVGPVTVKYSKMRRTLPVNSLVMMIIFMTNNCCKAVLWKRNSFFPLHLSILWVLFTFLLIALFMKEKTVFGLLFFSYWLFVFCLVSLHH